MDDVGWYGSAYTLTACSFQLVFGKIYTLYPTKWILLTTIAIFEIGSTVSGAAPNSTAFILGRAISGLGSAGVFTGCMSVVVYVVPLHKRPIYAGLGAAMMGIASVVGPLLGGVFTQYVSWRWCFYINLPIGGLAMAIITVLLRLPVRQPHANMSKTQQFLHLDPLGSMCFLPSIVCLLLALQWGGSVYPWSSARIIVLLVLFSILLIAFITIQFWQGERATVPIRIISQRSIAAGMFYAMCGGAAMLVMAYYLAIWFQVIKSASAVNSGIMSLPMMLSLILCSIISGGFTMRIGYYVPSMLLSAVLLPIGAGLITTFTVSTGHARWIGYQVILGSGIGFGMQQPNLASQAILARKDYPIGAALMFFAQNLGGSVFISVAQNTFTNQLIAGLSKIPQIDISDILETGATEVRDIVSAEVLPQVLVVYNTALRSAFQIALGVGCFLIVGAVFMEWRTIKKDKARDTASKESKRSKETAVMA
jgi:MFS family permease